MTCRLRPFSHADVPAIVSMCNDLDFSRMLARIPHPYSTESAVYFVDVVCSGKSVGGVTERVWAVQIDERVVGAVSLAMDANEKNSSMNCLLGIWIGREYWRNGTELELSKCCSA